MDLEEGIFFDMDTVVPLSIVVNELVSNSFKHAFSSKNKGVIQIKLCSEEARNKPNNKEKPAGKGSEYTLVVSDDGAGIPEEIDFEDSGTLGMQLVATLVDQLEGKIKLKKDKGTEFEIRFRVQPR